MSIEMMDKKAALKQCTEQRFTTKHCMHISPQHTQNMHMLCHYLFATGKILEKMQIIWGRATDGLMFEGKSNKFKIGAK